MGWAQKHQSMIIKPEKQIDIESPRNDTTSLKFLEYSPDSTQLAVGDDNGNLYLLDIESGSRIGIFQPNPDEPVENLSIQDVNFGKNGLLVAWSNGAIGMFEVSDEKLVLKKQLRPPSNPRADNRIAFSPDGRLACVSTSGRGTTVQLVDLKKSRALASVEVPGRPGPVTFSPDGSEVAFAVGDTIGFMNKKGREARTALAVGDPVYSFAYSPDQNTFLAGIRGEDPLAPGIIRKYDLSEKSVPAPETIHLQRTQGIASSIHYTVDGSKVIFDCVSTIICDAESLETLERIATDAQPRMGLALSPDGRWLAISGWGDIVELLNAETVVEDATVEE